MASNILLIKIDNSNRKFLEIKKKLVSLHLNDENRLMRKTISCIIVDDEPLAVKLLETYVSKTPMLALIGSFTDSVEAINAIKQCKPDLLFLDIQMPDLNGMELAHMLSEGTKVIFTTAFKEYAYESYEVNAIDFLLKPIRYNKFIAAVEKASEWFGINEYSSKRVSRQPIDSRKQTATDSVFIKVDGEFRQISIDMILYVSGMKDYVMVYLENEHKPLVTYLRMKVVEEMLPRDKFMRVNRSYIVALDKIKKVDRNDCIYIGEEIIHVTDAFHDAFLSYLQEHQVK